MLTLKATITLIALLLLVAAFWQASSSQIQRTGYTRWVEPLSPIGSTDAPDLGPCPSTAESLITETTQRPPVDLRWIASQATYTSRAPWGVVTATVKCPPQTLMSRLSSRWVYRSKSISVYFPGNPLKQVTFQPSAGGDRGALIDSNKYKLLVYLDQWPRSSALLSPPHIVDSIDSGSVDSQLAAAIVLRHAERDTATVNYLSMTDGIHGPLLFFWRDQDTWPDGLLVDTAVAGPIVSIGPIRLQESVASLEKALGPGARGTYCLDIYGKICRPSERYTDGNLAAEIIEDTRFDAYSSPQAVVVGVRVVPNGLWPTTTLPKIAGSITSWRWSEDYSVLESPAATKGWTTVSRAIDQSRYCDGFWCATLHRRHGKLAEYYIGP